MSYSSAPIIWLRSRLTQHPKTTGSSLYPEWSAQWALDYCILHSAILVAGDYRLIPESTGLDILDDLSDFWAWTRSESGLSSHLAQVATGVYADLSRTIVYGESAGGYLAIQSGLIQPAGTIKAVIATYPLTDPGQKRDVPVMGAPNFPPELLASHLKAMVPGRIVTSAEPPARLDIAMSLVQQDVRGEFFGTDDRLYPTKVMQKVESIPQLLIMHGRQDTGVPVEWSEKFVKLVKEKFGDEKVDLVIEDGQHGFDVAETLETSWVKEGLVKITEAWLGPDAAQ